MAIVGGVVTGLSYLLLPVASVPFVGSMTAPTLARLAQGAPSLSLLHVVPVVAAVVVVIGLGLLLASTSGRAVTIAAGVLILCAVLNLLAYLLPFGRLQDELSDSGVASAGIDATTFAGSGFWVAVIGAIVTAAGAAIELTGARARAAGRG